MEKQKIIWLKIFRPVKFFLYSLVFLVILYFSLALLFSYLPTHPPDHDCTPGSTVYIASNGIHIDFIFPVNDRDSAFIPIPENLSTVRFVSYGWGDKNFYIKTPEWSDLTFLVAFKALFLKSEAAMHITFYQNFQPGWKEINLCDWQMNELNRYIENSFEKDKHGNPIKMKFEGYSRYDVFYEAKGSFSLIQTCNEWINKALKEIEIKTSVWSPFDFGVMYHIKNAK